ncbi:HNH endonuclease [Chryseobacterium turcicum]|uniref:HNH endonuclease n=1 Tax=Chryseobacterium turcicum TaxID=2898076 RepID=A0A9Q3V441_9FLAO|nr:HNH endonuclease [Chryseobacterium turcicum]MCD1117812.1 HNH endonuclease [Chryseobacterium turcicum]
MNIENLDDYVISKVIYAYLIESKSHRQIQKEILGLPAPQKGGGFVTMEVLHHFNLKKEAKGILSENLNQLDTLNVEVQEIICEFLNIQAEAEALIQKKQINPNNNKTERLTTVKARVYQDVLKKHVSENYNHCCSLCENDQPELLVASHIVPWKSDESKRLDLDNCILLCNFHDKLFDKGFITLTDEYSVLISEKLSVNIAKQITNTTFQTPKFESPNSENLKLHREEIFR